jgi:heme-degrading monooxygenase HmoA
MRHTRVALYDITSGTYADVLDKAKTAGLVSMFEANPGFQSFALAEIDDATFLSLSTWETREQADTASSIAADWAKTNIGEQVRLRHNFVGALSLDTAARALAGTVS